MAKVFATLMSIFFPTFVFLLLPLFFFLKKSILVPVLGGRHFSIFSGLILDAPPGTYAFTAKNGSFIGTGHFSPLHGLFRKRGGIGTGIFFPDFPSLRFMICKKEDGLKECESCLLKAPFRNPTFQIGPRRGWRF